MTYGSSVCMQVHKLTFPLGGGELSNACCASCIGPQSGRMDYVLRAVHFVPPYKWERICLTHAMHSADLFLRWRDWLFEA